MKLNDLLKKQYVLSYDFVKILKRINDTYKNKIENFFEMYEYEYAFNNKKHKRVNTHYFFDCNDFIFLMSNDSFTVNTTSIFSRRINRPAKRDVPDYIFNLCVFKNKKIQERIKVLKLLDINNYGLGMTRGELRISCNVFNDNVFMKKYINTIDNSIIKRLFAAENRQTTLIFDEHGLCSVCPIFYHSNYIVQLKINKNMHISKIYVGVYV